MQYSKTTTGIFRQKGDILTESIIAVFLFAIAGVSVSYITSKVFNAQRDTKLQQLAINEMRSMVISRDNANDLCGTTHTRSFNNTDTTISIANCSLGDAVITPSDPNIASATISNVAAPVVLSANITSIGEVRVGGAEVEKPEGEE